jgi:hypothetical protein
VIKEIIMSYASQFSKIFPFFKSPEQTTELNQETGLTE